MTIFDVLTLFGGLAMFLYGMKLMGNALKESSSGTLKNALDNVTNNFFKAFLLGTGLTALIQSSTATIVITSGLVGAGLLTLHQSLGILVGANVGTTITGQIIRLIDLDAEGGGAAFLQFLKPSTLAPIALIIGIVLIMGFKFKNSDNVGNIAMGFGILFMGLMTMTNAVNRVSSSEIVHKLLMGLGDNPLFGYAVGAGIAFVLQSSSATIGILQAFSASGLLTFKAIYPVILGVYLGDCVTTFIVCTIGANTETKRVGLVNIMYNAAKTITAFVIVTLLHRLGFINALWDMRAYSGLIANTNTVFNLACAFLLFPVMGILEKLSIKAIPEKKQEANKYQDKLDALNPSFFPTPALALRSCYDILVTAINASRDNLKKSFDLLISYNEKTDKELNAEEDNIDTITDRLRKYTVELVPHLKDEDMVAILNQYFKVTTEFEHLGDQAVYITDIARTIHSDQRPFSRAALEEFGVLRKLIVEILDCAQLAFEKRDLEAAYRIEPLEQVVTDLIEQLKLKHLQRMGAGECSTYADAYYMNLLSYIQRIADICSNIGLATIVRVHPDIADREHLYVRELHSKVDETFNETYFEARERYLGEFNSVVSKEPKHAENATV